MDDWRNRAAQRYKAWVAQQKAQMDAEDQRRFDAERDAKLKVLAKFKCHICGKVSQEPYSVEGSHGDQGTNGYTDWERPGDLAKCIICGKWACAREHIYLGVCQKCASSR